MKRHYGLCRDTSQCVFAAPFDGAVRHQRQRGGEKFDAGIRHRRGAGEMPAESTRPGHGTEQAVQMPGDG